MRGNSRYTILHNGALHAFFAKDFFLQVLPRVKDVRGNYMYMDFTFKKGKLYAVPPAGADQLVGSSRGSQLCSGFFPNFDSDYAKKHVRMCSSPSKWRDKDL